MDKVVHFEIPADDIKRAESFYKKTFGWEVNQATGGMPYWFVKTVACDDKNIPKEVGAINGGIFERQEGESPLIIINVTSIDASSRRSRRQEARPSLKRSPLATWASTHDLLTQKEICWVFGKM